MLTRWSHLWYWLMKIELSALIIDYSSQDYSNLAVRADVTRMVFMKHNAKHKVFSVQSLAWISELESCGQDVRTSVSELLRSVSAVSPLFKNFLDSQCSVTLLAFWPFVVYKSAEWNKQRCMNLHISAKMHAQVKTKVKLGIKMDGEGNEGKLELVSCYLCICRSVNAARVRTDATFYSCLRVGWFNFCPRASQLYRPDRKKLIYQLYKLHRRDSEFALHVGIFLAADIKLRV